MSSLYYTTEKNQTVAYYANDKYLISEPNHIGYVSITHDPSGISFLYPESEIEKGLEEIADVLGSRPKQ